MGHQQKADWSVAAYDVFQQARIKQVAYVPDAGHASLIGMCMDSPEMVTVPLTTEEEGIALLTGAWLGGSRGVLLMQSSGVGNCINMLSISKVCEIPILMLVTMRGEDGETNPWQEPMGKNMDDLLSVVDVTQLRLSDAANATRIVNEAIDLSFNQSRMVAVCIAQSLIGVKQFETK